ncbi:hypothetical protein PUV54_03745 [Hyphococcus flavus]|uniref:Uncharacterized protein n=1 Tax=Hyphococcus flavus TaxID=1866326 RepID=A0AAE9ZCH9_9PROT|nr:hypothetical protein [Hyphococcus flavus]WDI32304.1 hypothetical protein PUV54_03745 [Hyphococcus flavus]
MKYFSRKNARFVMLCSFFLATNANADDEISNKPSWVGKAPITELTTIEVDCDGFQYKASFSQQHRQRAALIELRRSPAPFSEMVEKKFSTLLSEFFIIEKFELSCGAGPLDFVDDKGDRYNPFSDHPDEDFTGRLKVHLVGYHSADPHESMKNCEKQQGKFEYETWRYVTLTTDTIHIYPSVIGTCQL